MRPRVILIVARARNGVIGHGNRLPWHLPEELRQFKARTMDHALIIGRATWDSIGRPLPGRRMIVLTAQPGWQADGCERADSLEHALRIAATSDPARPQIRTDQAFVAGGAQVYRQALPIADRMLVTQVELSGGTEGKVGKAFLLQTAQDGRAYHAAVTGDVYFGGFVH